MHLVELEMILERVGEGAGKGKSKKRRKRKSALR